MTESWLTSAERIAHLAAISGANTIGVTSIDGDAGGSTLSRLICQVLSGGGRKALFVDLTRSVTDAAEGAPVWQQTNECRSDMVATPTTANRFLFNDVSALRDIWREQLASYPKLVVDLPPVLHERDDLLSPLATAASCDAVFLVCRQGTARWRLTEAADLLRASHVNIAGIVVNGPNSSVEQLAAGRPHLAALHKLPEDLVARRLILAAWRRRLLILVPILLMLPLSVLAAKLLPVPYVAKTLLLLQEPGTEGATHMAVAVPGRIDERAPALESLLKSHRVLAPALEDLREAGLIPPKLKGAIADFQDRLALRLVGLDILEIDLKGDTQKGLGRQLEAVVTQFLAVLTTDQSATTAAQLLVQRRMEALSRTSQAHAATLTRMAAIFPNGQEDALAQLASLEGRLKSLRADLAAVEAELNSTKRSNGSSPSAKMARKNELLLHITELEAKGRELKQAIEEYRGLEGQKLALEAEIAAAQKAYADLSGQYGTGAEIPQRLLAAPEHIRIIDPPDDPETAEISRLLYVAFGVAASVLLGVGLAWGAEQLDPSLRDRQEFSAAAGFPVVARLARLANADPKQRKRRRWLGFVHLTFLLPVALWLFLQFNPVEAAPELLRIPGAIA